MAKKIIDITDQKIIGTIGFQHYRMHHNHPLLMLFVFPFLVIMAVALSSSNSGVMLEYSITSDFCASNTVSCLKIWNTWVPNWLLFRSGIILFAPFLYYLMYWTFHTKHWQLWWWFYFLYGYVSLLIISSMLSTWIYFVPHLHKSYACLFEALVIFVFFTQNLWEIYNPILKRIYKIMLYLIGISGIVGAVWFPVAYLFVRSSFTEIGMFIAFLLYLTIIFLMVFDWNKKLRAAKFLVTGKKGRKNKFLGSSISP